MMSEVTSDATWPHASTTNLALRPSKRPSKRPIVVVAFVVIVLFTALGVASSRHARIAQLPVQIPTATAASWFRALNACDQDAINAYFTPARRGTWTCIEPFTHVHCVPESRSTTSATVRCTFDPQNDPRVGNTGDTFWSVFLQRSHSQRWLVADWGQP